jgi:nitrous oxide reductase
MMKKFIVVVCFIIGMGSIVPVCAKDENKVLPKNRIDVYYLHNTFRCMSCNTIESLTKAAVLGGKGINQKYKNSIEVKPAYEVLVAKNLITFKSVNIDEKENKHLLKDLKAESKFPVLVKIKDGKVVKTEVLDKVWDLMGDNQKFIDYIRKNLNEFLK